MLNGSLMRRGSGVGVVSPFVWLTDGVLVDSSPAYERVLFERDGLRSRLEKRFGKFNRAHEGERAPRTQEFLEREGPLDDGVFEHGAGEGDRELYAALVAVGYGDEKNACTLHETKPIFGLVVQSLVQVMVSVPFGASQALWHGP